MPLSISPANMLLRVLTMILNKLLQESKQSTMFCDESSVFIDVV